MDKSMAQALSLYISSKFLDPILGLSWLDLGNDASGFAPGKR
jgi:hypothetical protein